MNTDIETRDMILLDEIEHDPDITQASLAEQLGVAVGTVNWHLKRLIDKGYVKAKRAQRKKLRYIITPEGIALRAKLTVNYIENSMRLYRRTRLRVVEYLDRVAEAGFDTVRISGENDLAEVIRLTCIEQGFQVGNDPDLPLLEIRGWKVYLILDGVPNE